LALGPDHHDDIEPELLLDPLLDRLRQIGSAAIAAKDDVPALDVGADVGAAQILRQLP
jgi:hypothetical protein